MIIISHIELDEMPEDCSCCPLVYDNMYCLAVNLPKGRGIRFDEKRPDWCPLMDITKPVIDHMARLVKLFSETIAKLEASEE